jgi:hypothetical protein
MRKEADAPAVAPAAARARPRWWWSRRRAQEIRGQHTGCRRPEHAQESDGSASDELDDQSLFNILLLLAIIMSYAVDTSICERGFALMNNLKTARRSSMGNLLLRTLMTICELGKLAGWEDPTKIPVDEIVEEWRGQSKRGRYESAMWRAAGLQEPRAGSSRAGSSRCAHNDEDMAAHGDEHAAFRTHMGWAPGEYRPAPRVIPAPRAPPAAAAATPARAAAHPFDIDDSDDE